MHDNSVLDAIRHRRSIRKYTAEPVSRDQTTAILEAGRWAPSGLNNQPWRFMVIESTDLRHSGLAECTKYGHIVQRAPVLISVFLDRKAIYSEMKDHQSAGAVIQNMLLAAHAMGLGTVWLGEIVNQSEQVCDVLGVDSGAYELQAVIALGHPDQKGSSQRKPLSELLIENF